MPAGKRSRVRRLAFVSFSFNVAAEGAKNTVGNIADDTVYFKGNGPLNCFRSIHGPDVDEKPSIMAGGHYI